MEWVPLSLIKVMGHLNLVIIFSYINLDATCWAPNMSFFHHIIPPLISQVLAPLTHFIPIILKNTIKYIYVVDY